MNKFLLFCVVVLAVLIGCDKDKFETTPTLKIIDAKPSIVDFNSIYRVELEFTDKEGDVFAHGQDYNLIIIRERLNRRGLRTDSILRFQVPVFPTKSKGEILLTLPHSGFNSLTVSLPAISIPGSGNPPLREPDTLRLGFVLKDTAGNKTDTPRTNVIVIRN